MGDADMLHDLTAPWQHGEHAENRGVALPHGLSLDDKRLRGMDFSQANFGSDLTARGALFQGLSWFARAQVVGTTDFSEAHFRTDLHCEGMVCDTLNLLNARVEGVVRLDQACIGSLDLTGAFLMANLSLDRAQIGTVKLGNAIILGGIWAEEAKINKWSGTAETLEGWLRGDASRL